MEARTLGISTHDDGTFFSSWTEVRPLLVRAASGYVRNRMIEHSFHALSFHKNEKGIMRELHGLHQKLETTSSPSTTAFLRTASYANETTTAIMEQMFFNTMKP